MYFPMPKPIQMAADGYKAIKVMKNPYHYNKNIRIHGADKNLGKECFLVGIVLKKCFPV